MKNPKLTEEEKLVIWFSSDEGKKFGELGDYHSWSPAETAIYYMHTLLNIKKGLKEIEQKI